jgi:hypothetical protein
MESYALFPGLPCHQMTVGSHAHHSSCLPCPVVAFLKESSIGHLGCIGRHALLYQWTNIKNSVEILLLCSPCGGPGELAGTFVMMYAMTC